MPNTRLSWLDATHPVYDAWAAVWARQERLLRGGIYVKDELRRFDWETAPRTAADGTLIGAVATGNPVAPLARPGEHYEHRQRQAVYMNFPDMFASVTVGHLIRKAPVPNFGTLGKLTEDSSTGEPTDADLVYYNVDGVGNDGSQWDNYWATSVKRAMATGHRWHLVEAPIVRPVTRADILAGRRPYMIELSPLRVPQWEYENGVLQYAVLRVPATRSRVVDGRLITTTKPDYLLLVRRGFTALDGEGYTFSTGGWWRFAGEDKGDISNGAWDKTRGEIPLFPLFYERDEGVDGHENADTTLSLDALPAMSRPAMVEVANAAVAYMNLTSAVNFELWDGAKGMEWLRGVDRQGWELAMEKVREGSRWVPLRTNAETDQTPDVTSRQSDGGVIEAFKARLDQIRVEVRELMSQELAGTPDASGVSKQAGFDQAQSPRLARLASELEQAQNTALYFLELRFGNATPSGVVAWPRDFELIDFTDLIERFLGSQNTAGIVSPTATARALATLADEAGLVEDATQRKTIEDEFRTAAEELNASNAANARLLAVGGTGDITPDVPVA